MTARVIAGACAALLAASHGVADLDATGPADAVIEPRAQRLPDPIRLRVVELPHSDGCSHGSDRVAIIRVERIDQVHGDQPLVLLQHCAMVPWADAPESRPDDWPGYWWGDEVMLRVEPGTLDEVVGRWGGYSTVAVEGTPPRAGEVVVVAVDFPSFEVRSSEPRPPGW